MTIAIIWLTLVLAILLMIAFMGLISGVGFITSMAGLIIMVIFIFLSMDGTSVFEVSNGVPVTVYTFSQTSSDVFHGYGGWFCAVGGLLLALLGALRS